MARQLLFFIAPHPRLGVAATAKHGLW